MEAIASNETAVIS